MTVGSKLNGYGHESNTGLHSELYQNDGIQTADAHHLNSHYNNGNRGPENMQFHRVPYISSYNQFIVNTDTLI
jgi:hypothetical protein